MSEPFTLHGWWWLPGKPDDRVPGTLVFSPETGSVLTLIGALTGWAGIFQGGRGGAASSLGDVVRRTRRYPRVLGEVDGGAVTLDDCFQKAMHGAAFGQAHQEVLSVARVFRGIWFEEGEEPSASAVRLDISYLGLWAGEAMIQENYDFPTGTDALPSVSLEVASRADRTVVLDDGVSLALQFEWGIRGSRENARTLFQHYDLGLTSAAVQPLNDLLDTAGDAQDLVSIATGRSAAFLSVHAHHPALARTLGNGQDYSPPYEVCAPWSIRDNAVTPGEMAHHEMLFTLADLGGIEGMGSWMRTAAKFRGPLGRTTSVRSTPRMFVTDRLINYTAALEAMDRALHPQTGKQNLSRRLKRCGEAAGPQFTALVGKVSKWAEAVAYHRDDAAHHLGRRADGAQSLTYYLSESAYWAFVLLMLRQADAPAAVFDRIAEHNTLTFIQPEIQSIVGGHKRDR